MANNTRTLSIESETTNLSSKIISEMIIPQQGKNVNISYGPNADRAAISETTLEILRKVGKASKNYDIYITSTARNPYNQARVMYENIVGNGMAEQRRIYKGPGQRVLDVYVEQSKLGKNRKQIISAMEKKIIALGPTKVSKHCADHNQINVIDVSIPRLTHPSDFFTQIKSKVDHAMKENICYHIEIKQ